MNERPSRITFVTAQLCCNGNRMLLVLDVLTFPQSPSPKNNVTAILIGRYKLYERSSHFIQMQPFGPDMLTQRKLLPTVNLQLFKYEVQSKMKKKRQVMKFFLRTTDRPLTLISDVRNRADPH